MAGKGSSIHKRIQRSPVNLDSMQAGVRVQGPIQKPCDNRSLKSDIKVTWSFKSSDVVTDDYRLRKHMVVWLTNCQGQGRAGKLGVSRAG